jgi:hypothetical protein
VRAFGEDEPQRHREHREENRRDEEREGHHGILPLSSSFLCVLCVSVVVCWGDWLGVLRTFRLQFEETHEYSAKWHGCC